MIHSALKSALKRINDTRKFLELSEKKPLVIKHIIESEEDHYKGIPQDWANETATFVHGRTYDYACAIILLYGLFERFMEEVAEEYLNALTSNFNNYEDLPSTVKSSYFELTLSQLQRTQDPRYHGKNDAINLTRSLLSCMSNEPLTNFINEPFIHHTSNFRIKTVDLFLGKIGIKNASQRAAETDIFQDYNERLTEKKVIQDNRKESLWNSIDDLVERRNQVAHGELSNYLASSELFPFCDIVETYCNALNKVILNSLIEVLAEPKGVCHNNPIAVHNHIIVCINSNGAEIKPGSMLACKDTNGNWYALSVDSVQIDKSQVSSSPKGQNVQVGLKTSGGRCKEEHIVYSLS